MIIVAFKAILNFPGRIGLRLPHVVEKPHYQCLVEKPHYQCLGEKPNYQCLVTAPLLQAGDGWGCVLLPNHETYRVVIFAGSLLRLQKQH